MNLGVQAVLLDTSHSPEHWCQLPLLCCSHGPASHYCWWNKYVANPIKAWGYSGKGRTAMRVLKVCSVIGSSFGLLFIAWPATQQQACPADLILLSNSITSELLNLLWAVTGGDPACHPAAPHQGRLRRRAVAPSQVRLHQAAAQAWQLEAASVDRALGYFPLFDDLNSSMWCGIFLQDGGAAEGPV